MVYNEQHQFYCGVDLHARSMFTHILDKKGKTVFEEDRPAAPEEFLHAIKPFRKNWIGPRTGDRLDDDEINLKENKRRHARRRDRPMRPDRRVNH